jgi:hypothetical protein
MSDEKTKRILAKILTDEETASVHQTSLWSIGGLT